MLHRCLAFFVALCCLASMASAATVTVHVFSFDFTTDATHTTIVDPVIHVGDTVHWVLDDGIHCTSACSGMSESWASGLMSTVGQSFDHTFTHAGVFGYYCCLHGVDNGDGTAGGMSGTITVLPPEVAPTSFQMFRGMLVSGGLADLLHSDDQRLVTQLGIVLNQAEAPIQVIINGTSPAANPTSFDILVEAKVSESGLSQTIELFDYSTNSFVAVDSRSATTSDSVVMIAPPNPSRFVQNGTLAMQAKISYRATGLLASFPYRASIDQAVWLVQ